MTTYYTTHYKCSNCRNKLEPLEIKDNCCPYCGVYLSGVDDAKKDVMLEHILGIGAIIFLILFWVLFDYFAGK